MSRIRQRFQISLRMDRQEYFPNEDAEIRIIRITIANPLPTPLESQLIKIDETQFGWMVDRTLLEAENRRNPFALAYQGLELGDSAVDKRIVLWTTTALSERRPPLRNFGPRTPEPVPEFEIRRLRQWWADAMLERYRGIPTESQWTGDPIASGVDPSKAGPLHKEMLEFCRATQDKRGRK